MDAVSPLETLLSSRVIPCDSEGGAEAPLGTSVPGMTNGKVVCLMLTHFADFDSWELARGIMPYMDTFEQRGIQVVAVGIGSRSSAIKFAELTGFPRAKLFCDPDAAVHAALGFAAGFGRSGGMLGDNSLVSGLSGIVKLLVMCAGIGSPGTLKEVRVSGGSLARPKRHQFQASPTIVALLLITDSC